MDEINQNASTVQSIAENSTNQKCDLDYNEDKDMWTNFAHQKATTTLPNETILNKELMLNNPIDTIQKPIAPELNISEELFNLNNCLEHSELPNPLLVYQQQSIEQLLPLKPIDYVGHKRKSASAASDEHSKVKKTTCPIAEEKKNVNLRKNIRDVMNETQLDTNTIEAQREESERLARVVGQQKSLRDIQKYITVGKQYIRGQSHIGPLLEEFAFEKKETADIQQIENREEKIKFVEDLTQHENKECNDISSVIPLVTTNDDTMGKETDEDSLPIATDVVTIEDSSSDDDCILLSEEEEFNESDDATNSGMHVNDTYNIPDDLGRVVVNIGHPEGEETIFLAPQIAKIIKPHQIGGVRFLYDNIIESTKRFHKSSGFGCILAHSMGLGKTLQIISFCDIFLRHTSAKKVLCVMPINTLQNWLSEFNMWTPRASLNENYIRPRHFDIFLLNDQQKTLSARAKVILNWEQEGGVLLIGYELFRLLALKLIPTRKKRTSKNIVYGDGVDGSTDLIDRVYQALVKPGPDLVICDEGHRIKNSHAGISQALKQIRTRRRVVLTGYPLQNNLLEYWCMVDFVRPNYLGTRTEFCNMFERPIQNGQCVDSTPDDKKLMRYRAHVLHSLLVGFVQRRSHEVLHETLPEKLEYVILVRMTAFQKKLYETFMTDVVRKKAFPNPLKAFAVCCKIWNHPDVLYNFLKKCETDLDLEIDEEPTKNNSSSVAVPVTVAEPNVNSNPIIMPKNIEKNDFIKAATSPNVDMKPIGNNKITEVITNNGLIQNNRIIDKLHPGLNVLEGGQNTATGIQQAVDLKTGQTKGCNMQYYMDGEENFANYGTTDNRPNNFWLETTIPSKPTYIATMVQQAGATSGLENATGSSEIVDLDTNEIKTIESDIHTSASQQTFTSTTSREVDTSSTNTNSSASIASSKEFAAACDMNKKLQKQKRLDEFSCSWAVDIMKNYEPDIIENSPKMEIFFCILRESIHLGDRLLLFSQSLLTLNLIEGFLKSNCVPGSNSLWTRNVSYFRLDGSTSSQEREKLVNEFNSNPCIKLFLISTRAGSLGINLTGANRVIIFDASWNPCHDTQAVYRIYRYGQKKPCYVYRIVMDKCLEKKIYDRQIKKQGMSDRVVDECNPDAHLSLKEVTNLCHDYDSDDDYGTDMPSEETKSDGQEKSTNETIESPTQQNGDLKKPEEATTTPAYADTIVNKIMEYHKNAVTKPPFFHESLLIDRKDRKLSQAEKRQAHKSYEMEKKASVNQKLNSTTNKIQYKIVRNDGTIITRPVASIRPMQAKKTQVASGSRTARWIPAEVWQRQGMTAQEMTLPLDVVIPTNSLEKSNIILKAGQRVMVLKSAKGIYMQLESGKIIAIRTTAKASERDKDSKGDVIDITSDCDSDAPKKNAKQCEDVLKIDKRPDTVESTIGEISKKPQQHEIAEVNSTNNTNSTATKSTKTIADNQSAVRHQTQQQQQQPQQPQQQQQQRPANHQKTHGSESQKEYSQQFYTHLTQQSQQHHQQLIKHPSYMSHISPQHQNFNNSFGIQSNFTPPVNTADSNVAERIHLQATDFHARASQYYDYYDNKPVPCNYQLNDYSPYGQFNYSPYHSHFYPPTTYEGTSPAYINPNSFPRHWNSSVNPNLPNDRVQSSGLIGNSSQQNEWSSQ